MFLKNWFDYFFRFDNAQRLQETGYGVKIDPYNFTANDLNSAVDQLFGDEKLKAKLKVAARRIQATDRHELFAEKVEKMIFNKWKFVCFTVTKLKLHSKIWFYKVNFT